MPAPKQPFDLADDEILDLAQKSGDDEVIIDGDDEPIIEDETTVSGSDEKENTRSFGSFSDSADFSDLADEVASPPTKTPAPALRSPLQQTLPAPVRPPLAPPKVVPNSSPKLAPTAVASDQTKPNITKVPTAALKQPSYSLHFVAGPIENTDQPLEFEKQYVFGRGKEADITLAEDLVSRRHAMIVVTAKGPVLSDMGSTNGVFVNGERIRQQTLVSGDRILIGTTIARIVAVGSDEESKLATTKPLQKSKSSTMTGRLEELPLVDLIQLFGTSRKSGVIHLSSTTNLTGIVQLQMGRLCSVLIVEKPHLTHKKALGQLLRIEQGSFEFVPPESTATIEIPVELQEPTEMLLMDAIRLIDELRVIESELPPLSSSIGLTIPMPAPLRSLSPELLDTLQMVIEHPSFEGVLDYHQGDDGPMVQNLLALLQQGFIQVMKE